MRILKLFLSFNCLFPVISAQYVFLFTWGENNTVRSDQHDSTFEVHAVIALLCWEERTRDLKRSTAMKVSPFDRRNCKNMLMLICPVQVEDE